MEEINNIMDYNKGKGKYNLVCLVDLFANHFISMIRFIQLITMNNMNLRLQVWMMRLKKIIRFHIQLEQFIEHSGLTDSGKPRFARYIRKRDDVTIKDIKLKRKSVEKRNNIIRIFGK